jgi:hypothetical protein
MDGCRNSCLEGAQWYVRIQDDLAQISNLDTGNESQANNLLFQLMRLKYEMKSNYEVRLLIHEILIFFRRIDVVSVTTLRVIENSK